MSFEYSCAPANKAVQNVRFLKWLVQSVVETNEQIKQMNAAENCLAETSQRELTAGVLKQAAVDLRRLRGATSAVEREFYLDAYRWVTSDDCSWPFSFLNICQSLNLAPETVREEILGDVSLGTFGYWTRHYGRAARRFKVFLSNIFTNERTGKTAQPVT